MIYSAGLTQKSQPFEEVAGLRGRIFVYVLESFEKRARTDWFSKVRSFWSSGYWTLDTGRFDVSHG
jgi:hypothetical protein